MKLSDFKKNLNSVSELSFIQTNGIAIPKHFHITEAGLTTKHFIDCGGKERTEKNISFQLWVADDYDHRLKPEKLLQIIGIAQRLFHEEDLEIEVEYQTETISRYLLDFNGKDFLLIPTFTACLAEDKCGIPPKRRINLSDLKNNPNTCSPGGNCC